jgi:hypothetical protein
MNVSFAIRNGVAMNMMSEIQMLFEKAYENIEENSYERRPIASHLKYYQPEPYYVRTNQVYYIAKI